MRNRRFTFKLLIALLMAGMVGAAAASNMAFKFSGLILQRNSFVGGTCIGVQCATPVALGFQSQFEGARLSAICALNTNFAFMQQTGSCTGTTPGNTICDFTRLDSLASRSCSAPASLGVDPPFQSTMGFRVVLKSTYTGPDVSHVFVSADRPGTQILIRHNAANLGSCVGVQCATLAALPLHTTARRLSDICAESPRFSFVAQAEACTGTLPSNTICDPARLDSLGTRPCSAAPTISVDPPVLIGRAVRIRPKSPAQGGGATGDFLWSPAHF